MALDTPIEASSLVNFGDHYPPVREKAIAAPSPVPLSNFQPLLFTDHEDPLLYALSDISLEDMSMSL